MDHQKEFFDASYQKLVDAIDRIRDEVAAEIYAFEFVIYAEEDDSRQLEFSVHYNTERQFQAKWTNRPAVPKPDRYVAKDEMDARWNTNLWMGRALLTVGEPPEDELYQKWIESSPFYYTDEEEEEWYNSKNDEEWDKHTDGLWVMYADMVIALSQKLHAEGVFVNKFGKTTPVLIAISNDHYYQETGETLQWILRANPDGVADEYVNWAYDYYGYKKP